MHKSINGKKKPIETQEGRKRDRELSFKKGKLLEKQFQLHHRVY
jgi:hypothetical protein